MGKSFNDSAITRILLSHRFADGGSMDSDKSDRPISQQRRDVRGVTEFNAGGSHEENPYGGVPQGIAPDGAPNLVEQGEVKLSDIIGQDNQYVLSNRIMVDAEHARQFNIPDSVVGMTYAAAFKKLYQPLKERNGNIEVKNEIAHLANAFMQAQDSIKAEQEAQQASAIMQALPPEAQQQVMQAAMGQQQGGQPSPQDQQAMQQQQMMAQQQTQMQQDPSMMGGQQMPPEAMMQQGGQPSPEEMAMMQQQMATQQQDPNAMAAQQPMMARGGKLYNQFSKGGNMRSFYSAYYNPQADQLNQEITQGPLKVLDVKGDKVFVKTANGKQHWFSKTHLDALRRVTYDKSKVANLTRALEQANQMQRAKSQNASDSTATQQTVPGSHVSVSPELNNWWETPNYNWGKTNQNPAPKASKPQTEPRPSSPAKSAEFDPGFSTSPYPYRDGIPSSPYNSSVYGLDETQSNSKNGGNSKRTGAKPQSKSKSSDKKNTSTESKSIEELANMVIRGKFGNGKARKEALGDKFAAVQKLVSEKMAASKAKKAKIKDERGGTKEVEIPSWVGKPDDLDKPIESKEPYVNTSDLGLSNLRPQGVHEPYFNEEYPFLEDESEFDDLLRRMHRQTAGL